MNTTADEVVDKALAYVFARDKDFQGWVQKPEASRVGSSQVLFAERTRCGCAMARLAEIAIVLRGNIHSDQLAFTRRQATRFVQQYMRQFAHGLGGLRTKYECPTDTG